MLMQEAKKGWRAPGEYATRSQKLGPFGVPRLCHDRPPRDTRLTLFVASIVRTEDPGVESIEKKAPPQWYNTRNFARFSFTLQWAIESSFFHTRFRSSNSVSRVHKSRFSSLGTSMSTFSTRTLAQRRGSGLGRPVSLGSNPQRNVILPMNNCPRTIPTTIRGQYVCIIHGSLDSEKSGKVPAERRKAVLTQARRKRARHISHSEEGAVLQKPVHAG